MTVLYFVDTRFPIERANGVQTMATCHALASRGHDVTLVVRPDTADVRRDPFTFYSLASEPNLKIHLVPSARRPEIRRVRFLLSAAAMAAGTSGVVYTRDLGLAAFLLQAPFRRRATVLYESHGVADVVASEMPRLLGPSAAIPSPRKLARLARREARVWRHAAAYVTITRALADELTTRFGPRNNVFVVPDGAHPRATSAVEVSRDAPRSPSRLPVVAYAGHLYPWKGVDVLVRALAEVPAARGLIIGGHPAEPDRQRIEDLARELGVWDRLEWTGLIPPAEVAGRLATASVLVLPNTRSAVSERYTSPLKLFEYLSLRLPIVASDLPAIREVLTHEQTALLVPPGDPHALAQAFVRLFENDGLAEHLAAAAFALAPEYTWARRAERLEHVLKAAVA